MTSFGLKGLQTLALRLNTDSVGTLGANTSLKLVALDGLTRSFLLKKVIYAVAWNAGATGDNLIFGLAQGSATVAEITTALASMNISNPNDATNQILLDQWKVIYYETIMMVSASAVGEGQSVLNERISIGGGKGIPLLEDDGVQVFAYNPSTGSVTGSFDGIVGFQGVWLND